MNRQGTGTDIRLAEHFALRSSRSLEDLCGAIEECFGLPNFQYSSESKTEWGVVLSDGLEYNVSCPYEDGTLQEWDSSVPPDCNVGFTLSVLEQRPAPKDAEQSGAELVPRIGQALADFVGQPVHHHRTWLGPGRNITRTRTFRPHA